MKRVGAALDDGVELAAGRMTELSAELILQKREALHCVVRYDDEISGDRLVIVVDTFDREVVVVRPLAANRWSRAPIPSELDWVTPGLSKRKVQHAGARSSSRGNSQILRKARRHKLVCICAEVVSMVAATPETSMVSLVAPGVSVTFKVPVWFSTTSTCCDDRLETFGLDRDPVSAYRQIFKMICRRVAVGRCCDIFRCRFSWHFTLAFATTAPDESRRADKVAADGLAVGSDSGSPRSIPLAQARRLPLSTSIYIDSYITLPSRKVGNASTTKHRLSTVDSHCHVRYV